MSDYISREAALQFVFDACSECMETCEEFDGIYADCHQCMLEGVKLKLRDLPAADVRPVVLCRDCIHCKKGKVSLECEKHTYAWNNMRRWVDEDDFCKWGVKREENR